MHSIYQSQQPIVMGILNVTPDSFSDGGRFDRLDDALRQAQQMINDGADIIDIGGESTRPGASPVSEQQEIDRVVPVIEKIASLGKPISIDTSKAAVMRAAVAKGANMINDVRALREEGALLAAAELQVPVCLMHMQGKPREMQQNPHYQDVVGEVCQFLQERIDACVAAGISESLISVDPGFGFGKTLAHNLALLADLQQFQQLSKPVLAGISRKSMLGAITDRPVEQRVAASVAAAQIAVTKGAQILRVHDVAETVDMLKLLQAVEQVSASA